MRLEAAEMEMRRAAEKIEAAATRAAKAEAATEAVRGREVALAARLESVMHAELTAAATERHAVVLAGRKEFEAAERAEAVATLVHHAGEVHANPSATVSHVAALQVELETARRETVKMKKDLEMANVEKERAVVSAALEKERAVVSAALEKERALVTAALEEAAHELADAEIERGAEVAAHSAALEAKVDATLAAGLQAGVEELEVAKLAAEEVAAHLWASGQRAWEAKVSTTAAEVATMAEEADAEDYNWAGQEPTELEAQVTEVAPAGGGRT